MDYRLVYCVDRLEFKVLCKLNVNQDKDKDKIKYVFCLNIVIIIILIFFKFEGVFYVVGEY